MVNYTTTPARDVETGLGQETVVLVEKKSSSGWMGKLLLAMFLMLVCCAGALLFTWFSNGRQEAFPAKTEALIQRSRTEPLRSLLSNQSKAAIHLEGRVRDGERGQKQLVWSNDQGQAFAQGGFKFQDNAVLIPASGLYFVYSQASFRVSCGDEDAEAGSRGLTPLSHRIWRDSDVTGGRSTLLSAVRSACQPSMMEGGNSEGQGWYNTIYLGAVFRLKAGDKLLTETNQLSQLEADEGTNFFGVFAL